MPNSGAYARTAVDFDAASGGTTDLTTDCTFPTASATGAPSPTSPWSTRPPTAPGTGIMHGALSASKQIDSGDTFRILAADLDVSA